MSDYRTDEETVEQLSRWWQENGTALILSVIVVVAGVFGWDYWQGTQESRAQAAAALYQDWQRAARNTGSEASQARAEEAAANLRSQFPDSSYVAFIALDRAQRAYAAEDVAGTRAALQEVLTLDVPRQIADLARLRLARLDYDAGEHEAALATLAAMVDGGSISAAEELRGDALLALGRSAEAREAYARALAATNLDRPILQMKHDDLQAPAGDAS